MFSHTKRFGVVVSSGSAAGSVRAASSGKSGWAFAIVAGLVLGSVLCGARGAGAQDGQNSAVAQQGDYDAGAAGQANQSDPPTRVARIGVLMGDVSLEPASVDQFSAAELNYPMTTGDRIYADTGANAELQTGQLAVRLGQQTDLTVTAMTDTLAQFGLAQGSVHLRSFGLESGETVELDTPNVAVTVMQPGDVRVDVDPASDTTTVALLSGQVEVDGNGLQQVLRAGQRVRLAGSETVSAQWLDAAAGDGLDSFSSDRDGVYESAVAGQSDMVSPDTIGAEDLEGNGDWETDATYGAVWYPSGVAVGWAPYSCGRWAWVAPWGWSWVGCESWGFAPFHYGRWNRFGERWGWVPGPPGLRPVYAPALVVFAGGKDFRVGGVAVTGWFPLGPGEPYVPWYHASPSYENRVNVADFNTRNLADARRIYNDRSDVYAAAADREVDHPYVNRALATVAVARTSFAAGRPTAGSAVRLSSEQATEAQLLPHPLVTPERSIVMPAEARALPPHAARPMLASREKTGRQPQAAVQTGQVGGVVEGSVPVQPRTMVRGEAQTPVVRTTAGQGTTGESSAGQNAGSELGSRDRIAPSSEMQRPAAQVGGGSGEAEQRPSRVTEPGVPAQRPLFNRAIPPPARPNFEEQQKAIQSVDPGRPLGPRQMQNLRENQPAGPPQQREFPHPPPPPSRPPPPPRFSPPAAPKR
jgi:hypothetical protein